MSVKYVSSFLCLFKNFVSLPPDNTNFISSVNQHFIINEILKIFILSYRSWWFHLFVKHTKTTEHYLIPQVIYYGIPK